MVLILCVVVVVDCVACVACVDLCVVDLLMLLLTVIGECRLWCSCASFSILYTEASRLCDAGKE